MGIASSFTESPFVYAGTRFLIGFSISRKLKLQLIYYCIGIIFYQCAIVIMMFCICSVLAYIILDTIYVIEILPSNSRTLCGALGPWAVGVMLLAPLAYFVESWEMLSRLAALPMALSLLSYP